MSIIQNIKNRTSVRSYTGQQLTSDQVKAVRSIISSVSAPFNSKIRIELVNKEEGYGTERLGTYGVISGVRDFLVAAYEPSSMAEYEVGYVLEEVILRCTELGLGTCWLGGTFKQSDFASAIGLKEEEILPVVSPVGVPAKKRTFIDAAMGFMARHTTRRKFETLFFDGGWDKALTDKSAGRYLVPLEMVRLAPSARNGQPWRVVLVDGMLHFYRNVRTSTFTKIDLGIALCHFELTCKEMDIRGSYRSLDTIPEDKPGELEYVISWVEQP